MSFFSWVVAFILKCTMLPSYREARTEHISRAPGFRQLGSPARERTRSLSAESGFTLVPGEGEARQAPSRAWAPVSLWKRAGIVLFAYLGLDFEVHELRHIRDVPHVFTIDQVVLLHIQQRRCLRVVTLNPVVQKAHLVPLQWLAASSVVRAVTFHEQLQLGRPLELEVQNAAILQRM